MMCPRCGNGRVNLIFEPPPKVERRSRVDLWAMAKPVRDGVAGGGGIKAASKPFLQAFPKLGLFCPSFSKENFSRFLGFQWVARNCKPKSSGFQIAMATVIRIEAI